MRGSCNLKEARWVLIMILTLAFICAGSFTSWTGEELRVEVTLIRTLSGHNDYVFEVAFSPDGQLLASGSGDETVKLWEVATGREVRTLSGHTWSVSSVAFSPDGKYLASGSSDDTIKLWEVATGREVRTLSGHTEAVMSVAFSPDGKYLASGSSDDTIKLWEVATGREVRTLSGHTDWVDSVAFSPDGKYLASRSWDDTIKLWEVATGREVRTISVYRLFIPVSSVAFSPDGKYLACGSDDTIKLWEVATGREVRTLSGHTWSVSSVAFSPDGKLLATGAHDDAVKLWEVATGREVRTLSGHTESVLSVTFSPDGKLLASGSVDGTIKLWQVQVKENQPPQASFTFSPAQPEVGQSVRFDASDSTDPDGTIISYAWDFGDGTTGSGKIATHVYNRSGRFTVTLTVTDDDGASDSTSMMITVIEANQPPQARFTYSPWQPTDLDVIQFTDQSTDPDGQVIKWHWDFGNGNAGTAQNPSHRYEDEGTYKVTLTVTDDDGASGSTSKTIAVIEANQPPQITLIDFPELVSTGVETNGTIEFSDPQGDISQAKFEVVEGALEDFTIDLSQSRYAETVRDKTEGSFNFALTVDQPGQYCIKVTLVDEAGLTSEPEEFSFEARTPRPPVITKVVFPSTIKVNQEQNGIVKFEDQDGDIVRAEFKVLEGDPTTIEVKPGMSFDPGVQGRTKSSFRFSVIATKAQMVKLRLTLIDSASLKSKPCEFTFEVK